MDGDGFTGIEGERGMGGEVRVTLFAGQLHIFSGQIVSDTCLKLPY